MQLRTIASIAVLVFLSYNCHAQNIFSEQNSRLSAKKMRSNLKQYIEKRVSENSIVGLSFAAVN